MTLPKSGEIPLQELDCKLPFLPAMQSDVLAAGRAFLFEQETVVFREGEKLKWALILVKGAVRLFHRNHNSDRELMMYEVAPKAPAKITCVTFYSAEYEVNMCAMAEPDSILLYIPVPVLEKWADTSLEWNKLVVESFRSIFDALVCTLKSVGTTNLEERILYLLKCRAQREGSDVIQLTHQQIANFVGSSRVVVSRILKEVETRGEIELQHGRVKLRSLSSVESLAV